MSKVFANAKEHWQDFLANNNTDSCTVAKDGTQYRAVWNGLTSVCYILDDVSWEKVDLLALEPDWDEEEGRYYERHFCERAFTEFGYTVTASYKSWVRKLYNLA